MMQELFDRSIINGRLNQLKQLFDMIEPCNPNENIGYRSLKNIGVWLIAYALTEKSQQLEVVQDLLTKVKANRPSEVKAAKSIIDLLSRPDNLTFIINDYVKANGTFNIIINNASRLQRLKEKAKEVGLSKLLEKHLKVDPSKDADLTIGMNNTLKFKWQDKYCNSAEFIQEKNLFNNEQIDYLTANSDEHAVVYDFVKLKGDLFHVVRLGALQTDGDELAKETSVYLIEPVDQKTDPMILQKNYFEIVSLFQTKGYIHERYAELKKIEEQSEQKSLNITDSREYPSPFCYKFIVHFPKLAGPLKTEEKRLGIYGSFLGKTIGSFYAGNLEYLGQRELEYDAAGGEIKNLEEIGIAESAVMPSISTKTITVEYTVKGPFTIVYSAEDGADYYPFKITDPRNNLEKSFSSSELYDRLSQHDSIHPMPEKPQTNIAISQASQPLFYENGHDLRSKKRASESEKSPGKKLCM